MRRIQDVLPKTPKNGKRLYEETQAALLASRSPFAAEPAFEAAKKARRVPRVLNGHYSLAAVRLSDKPAFKEAVAEHERDKAYKAAVEAQERDKENSVIRGIGKLGI